MFKAKSFLILLIASGFTLTGLSPAASSPVANAQVVRAGGAVNAVNIGIFRERLAPFGRWFTVPRFGFVWSPFGVAADWGPYVNGSWDYTDYGWTWISDDPWGWATCHYGRWYFDPVYGWVWVPGDVWGPAWVSWQFGAGWIGWGPLTPDFIWGPFGFADFGVIPVFFFRFCHVHHFAGGHVRHFIVPPRENPRLLKVTDKVTHFSEVNGRVINQAISRQAIETATGRRIETHFVRDASSPSGIAVRGNEVSMFRPRVGRSSSVAPATDAAAGSQAQPSRNRQIERGQMENQSN